MDRRRAALLVAAVTALAAAPAADAHFAFVPGEVPARSFARLQLQVPNEEPNASTVRVAVQVPDSVLFVRVPPTPGWQVNVEREPLDEPLLVGDRRVDERITVIEWSGGEITGANSQSFALRLAVPRAAGQTLAFQATQTYSDDQVVEWIGEPGSENPAPLLTVAPFDPSAPSLAIRPAPAEEPPPPPPTTTEEESETESEEEETEDTETTAVEASDEDDDGVSAPLLVALALGIAAAFAAGIWLMARRRAG